MPNTEWSRLNNLQLGRYAECYAKMEFASYGFQVYSPEVDDHGIDFIAKTKSGRFLEIQVKSVRLLSYVFMQKDKWNVDNLDLFLALLMFEDGNLPEFYLIPASTWKNPNSLFSSKDYEGLKSKPEFGLNLSKKNMPQLQQYSIERVLEPLLGNEH